MKKQYSKEAVEIMKDFALILKYGKKKSFNRCVIGHAIANIDFVLKQGYKNRDEELEVDIEGAVEESQIITTVESVEAGDTIYPHMELEH